MLEELLVNDICSDLIDVYNTPLDQKMSKEVAQLLCDLHMPKAVVRVGFIGRLRHLDKGIDDSVLARLSSEENRLLLDLNHITVVDNLLHSENQNIEVLRQMLLAMADDIRAVVIKLALQLVAMRHLRVFSEDKRKLIALQTRDIQAPLANRLGIAKLKWELEDLSLKELRPKVYHLIATSLSEQRVVREAYLSRVISDLTSTLNSEDFENVEVYGRAKNINSIYNKMRKKRKRLDEIYDLLAIRIHMSSLKDCYTALGVIHSKWRHIPSEFDDYIANPKPNGYQSLHTAVVGPDNRVIEIQLRTKEMHEYAEFGVAAHWKYKEEKTGAVSTFDRQINWLRNILSSEDSDIKEEFTSEITEDRVYAITPKGKVVDLPYGATPLDFSYYIHTDLGHRTKGAKVNGKLVSLTYQLQTGDTVEVITNKTPNPSRDWLTSNFGYLTSPKARTKVKHFFKQLELKPAIEEGKSLLEKEAERRGIKLEEKYLQKTIEKFNFKTVEKLYSAIGFGDIGLITVVNYIDDIKEDDQVDLSNLPERLAKIPIKRQSKKEHDSSSIMIEGIDDLLVSIASCCSPVPPEKINGLITTTKGVSIHKSSCPNYINLEKREPNRVMQVNWAGSGDGFSTNISLAAKDRVGLLRDVSQTLLNSGASIQKAEIDKNDEEINVQLQILVNDFEQMSGVINLLSKVKNVYSVIRVTT